MIDRDVLKQLPKSWPIPGELRVYDDLRIWPHCYYTVVSAPLGRPPELLGDCLVLMVMVYPHGAREWEMGTKTVKCLYHCTRRLHGPSC